MTGGAYGPESGEHLRTSTCNSNQAVRLSWHGGWVRRRLASEPENPSPNG